MNKLLVVFVAFTLMCCGKKVENQGEISLLNGKKEKVSIPYTCEGCSENINDVESFDKIVEKITEDTRNSLKYPLTYIPISLTFKVVDTLHTWFETGLPIDSLLLISFDFNYIAKNGLGIEVEGSNDSYFYLKNFEPINLEGKIKLADVKIMGSGNNKFVEPLRLYDYKKERLSIIRTRTSEKGLRSSIELDDECVKNSTTMIIEFVNDETIVKSSYNDFNCDGNLYYMEYTESERKLLSETAIKSITFGTDPMYYATVPANRSDYFIQVMKLEKEI